MWQQPVGYREGSGLSVGGFRVVDGFISLRPTEFERALRWPVNRAVKDRPATQVVAMTALTPDSASPWQARIERICTVFSDSPRLRAVATQRAHAWLDRHRATLNLSADTLAVGTPEGAYTRLPDVLLERLASGQPVLYTEGYHQVAKRAREN